MVIIAFSLVVFVSVVSPSCTAGVQSALTSVPGDDGGGDDDDDILLLIACVDNDDDV